MTAQIHDNVTVGGKRLALAADPDLPAAHPRIVEVDREVARKKPGSHIYFTTACWRGYRGSWKIEKKRLYLTSLSGRLRLTGKGPLLADWVSQVLRVPQGEVIDRGHLGLGRRYERELRLTIKRGVLTSRRTYDNRARKYVE